MATKYLEAAADFPGSVNDNGNNTRAIFVDTDDENAQFYDKTAAAWRKFVTLDQTQTLTGKTLTSPTITGPTISGAIDSDLKVLAANAAMASGDTGATLTTLTGFSWTVTAAGVYAFEFEGPVTMTTNGGLTLAFKLTTATLTSLALEAIQTTASAIAVAANFTTATDQAKFVDQKATAYTYVRITGTLVVLAAGSIAFQAAQNTSHIDTTTVLKGFKGRMVRTS